MVFLRRDCKHPLRHRGVGDAALTWDHRVFRSRGKHGTWYSIREVFYTKRGPGMYTKDAATPGGEALDELREELIMMLAATYKPIFKPGEIKR